MLSHDKIGQVIKCRVPVHELYWGNRGSYMSAHVLCEFIERVGEKR